MSTKLEFTSIEHMKKATATNGQRSGRRNSRTPAAELVHLKKQSRKADQMAGQRGGAAVRHAIQERNAFFKNPRSFRIVSFPESRA